MCGDILRPNNETRTIGKNEGVLLPHETVYWFKATCDEPLVMIRVGAAAFDGIDRHGRVAPDGSEIRGDSIENKQVELIMSDAGSAKRGHHPQVGFRSGQPGMTADTVGVPQGSTGAQSPQLATFAPPHDAGWLPAQ